MHKVVGCRGVNALKRVRAEQRSVLLIVLVTRAVNTKAPGRWAAVGQFNVPTEHYDTQGSCLSVKHVELDLDL